MGIFDRLFGGRSSNGWTNESDAEHQQAVLVHLDAAALAEHASEECDLDSIEGRLIEAILRGYPLCQRARVEIRRGGPGATSREVRL
jgi:hypothetical protein